MRPPAPLPEELPDAFDIATATGLGVPPGRLRRADLASPYRGVRLRGARPPAHDFRAMCAAYAPRLKPWQFFSHETALGLLGVPLPEWPHRPAVHVAAHRPAREPRLRGVVGHRLQTREPAVLRTSSGMPVEHPVRAWRQCARIWRLDDLIAAADHIVSRHWGDARDLAREIETMGDAAGAPLRRALMMTRGGVRSARETRLRLRLVRAGLPEPDVAWVLRDRHGAFVAELDLSYPRYRVAVEYDGRVHAEDAAQFRRDADRWDRIRAEGFDLVRILNHHMQGDAAVAVAKVADALRRAGWHPGAA